MMSQGRPRPQEGLNLDSSLSTLLRNLYLHGVEHCAPVIRGEYSILTKDQVVSILERGTVRRRSGTYPTFWRPPALSGKTGGKIFSMIKPLF
ncbi:hypothetical protein MASR2M17_03060 [Aminivibrio sp.]